MKSKKISIQQQHDYEVVVAILQKKDRTQKDLETLYNRISMLDGFNMLIQKYFQGSDVAEQIKLCGDLMYEKKNKGDIVFQQDEPSNNKLYIILNGNCHLFLLKELDFEEEKQEVEPELVGADKKDISSVSQTILDKMKKIGSKFKRQVTLDFDQKSLTAHEINQFKARYGKTTRIITVGSIFGELALINSKPRTATIVADSHPTELLVLDRDKFLPALEELKRTLQLRRDILFQIFKDMDNYSSARLESMLYSFSVKKKELIGQTITEQNQKDDKFYIIAEGEAQILKNLTIQISHDIQEERIAKLSIIGPGVMVGDEIMEQNEPKYSYTVEVTSLRASVLVADKKIIDRKFPKDLKDYLKKLSFYKERGRKILLDNKIEELKHECQQNQQKIDQRNMIKKFKTDDEVEPLKKAKQGNIESFNQDGGTLLLSKYHEIYPSRKNLNEFAIDQELPTLIPKQKQEIDNFNVKSQVFDFGDGKNVENAERLEKIFRYKNRCKEPTDTRQRQVIDARKFLGIKSKREQRAYEKELISQLPFEKNKQLVMKADQAEQEIKQQENSSLLNNYIQGENSIKLTPVQSHPHFTSLSSHSTQNKHILFQPSSKQTLSSPSIKQKSLTNINFLQKNNYGNQQDSSQEMKIGLENNTIRSNQVNIFKQDLKRVTQSREQVRISVIPPDQISSTKSQRKSNSMMAQFFSRENQISESTKNEQQWTKKKNENSHINLEIDPSFENNKLSQGSLSEFDVSTYQPSNQNETSKISFRQKSTSNDLTNLSKTKGSIHKFCSEKQITVRQNDDSKASKIETNNSESEIDVSSITQKENPIHAMVSNKLGRQLHLYRQKGIPFNKMQMRKPKKQNTMSMSHDQHSSSQKAPFLEAIFHVKGFKKS